MWLNKECRVENNDMYPRHKIKCLTDRSILDILLTIIFDLCNLLGNLKLFNRWFDFKTSSNEKNIMEYCKLRTFLYPLTKEHDLSVKAKTLSSVNHVISAVRTRSRVSLTYKHTGISEAHSCSYCTVHSTAQAAVETPKCGGTRAFTGVHLLSSIGLVMFSFFNSCFKELRKKQETESKFMSSISHLLDFQQKSNKTSIKLRKQAQALPQSK